MIDYDKILTSRPVNKTASIVTSCGNSYKTEREAIVERTQYIHDAIKSAKKLKNMPKQYVIELGLELNELNQKLKSMKLARKKYHEVSIEFVFMETCREYMHPLEFKRYLKMAMDKRGD